MRLGMKLPNIVFQISHHRNDMLWQFRLNLTGLIYPSLAPLSFSMSPFQLCITFQEFYLDRAAPKPAFRSHFCAVTHPSYEVWPFDFAKVLPQHNASSSTKVKIFGDNVGCSITTNHRRNVNAINKVDQL